MTPPRYFHDPQDRGGPGETKNDVDMKEAPEGPRGSNGSPEGGNKVSNLKVYVKPKGLNIPPEVMERRSRKNANSRSRAAKHRSRVAQIETKPQSEWTEEERKLIDVHYRKCRMFVKKEQL